MHLRSDMEKYPIVLDLETQKLFSEIDRSKRHLLRVSLVGIYDYREKNYFTFEEKEISKLESFLRNASFLIGFNIRDFDLEVLKPYLISSLDDIPVLDLLEEIERVRKHKVSLQSVAQATLKEGKSGSGLEAVQLFREGRMEELKQYCLDDVRITKALYEYGKSAGKVYFLSNRDWQVHEVSVKWGENEPTAAGEKTFPSTLF